MSIRHMIYTQAADLIVSSDSRYHTYAMQCRHSIFNRYLRKKKFVFLQHGVIALKRVDAFYSKGMRGGCDLFVVSTNQEKQTIVDNFGYEPDEVINTGLPRWDVLEDTSNGNREILIMPTWRSWLDSFRIKILRKVITSATIWLFWIPVILVSFWKIWFTGQFLSAC